MEPRTALCLPSLVLLLALTGCQSQAQAPASSAPVATPPKTQVFVMGMIHSGHLTSDHYGIDVVQDTIRSIQPDVICTEIPPANWPSTLATWNEEHIVEDSRVRVFPEYVDVMMPLLDELDFIVEPCAAWTPEMSSARSARIHAFRTGTKDIDAHKLYVQDEQWIESWLAAHPSPLPDDDPRFIHSPAYDLRTKAELGPYEHHLNDVIGAPGGWTYINEGHFDLIEAALTKHRGKRILITFGAGHKYWFLERLRSMPSVELMDLRPHLPGATAKPKMTGLGQDLRAAEEAFYRGYDFLRATWSRRPGANLPWLATKSPGLGELLAKKGDLRRTDEFLDQPVLANVQVELTLDGTFLVTAEARLPRGGLDQVGVLSGFLRANPKPAQGPQTFRWLDLELPDFLTAKPIGKPAPK